jgi:hypothetical protein
MKFLYDIDMTLLRNVRNEIESIVKLIVECFTLKYFQFSGRANRKEYLILKKGF